MKATELRIGNYIILSIPIGINKTEEIIKVERIDKDCGIKYAKPIPLTEDWLKKFRFDISKKPIEFIDRNSCLSKVGNIYYFWTGANREYFHTEIKYVHQLQNLYFALTGKEL